MFHESQTCGPMAVKICKLYILCTLILYSLFHLIVESRLILTKSELEFQIVVMSILKYFACV
jgi:hypothetical protein